MFISYSTFYHQSGKPLDPWNECVYVSYNNNIRRRLKICTRQLSQTREVLAYLCYSAYPDCDCNNVIVTYDLYFHFVSPFSDYVSY